MPSKLPTVAIIGQANVGKSSLFNRLTRARTAIVAREAGTTRDNVVGKVSYKRRALSPEEASQAEFWLIDTAGLKPAEDEFEATIQDQIADASAAADVILVMVDSTVYPSDADRQLAKKALKSGKPVLLIAGKADLKGSLHTDEFKRLGIKTIIKTSAEHNIGISELLDNIAELIPPAIAAAPDDIIRVALIGRPNVGKSNLFNTLAGKQQAIVANVAGTTRDVNRVQVRYHSQTIELLDTAGIRRQGKQETGIEKFSVLRTMLAINEADICFLLMDVNELNVQLDQRLAGIIDEAGKGLVLVVSKWDSVEGKDAYTRDELAPQISYHFKFTPYAPLIFTSSVTGQNVAKSARPASSTTSYKKPSPLIRQPASRTRIQNSATSSRPTQPHRGSSSTAATSNSSTGATNATWSAPCAKPLTLPAHPLSYLSATKNNSKPTANASPAA